jgi:hypothetical protein
MTEQMPNEYTRIHPEPQLTPGTIPLLGRRPASPAADGGIL